MSDVSQEEINRGYYYNYVHDAAHLFWAAKWFELHKSLDEKDQLLDQLIIRRIRAQADRLMHQAQQGMKIEMLSPTKSSGIMPDVNPKIDGT